MDLDTLDNSVDNSVDKQLDTTINNPPAALTKSSDLYRFCPASTLTRRKIPMKIMLTEADLPVLNAALETDEALAIRLMAVLMTHGRGVTATFDSLERVMQRPAGREPLETAIVEWLQSHPGQHSPGDIDRAVSDESPGGQAFKVALASLLTQKKVKAEGQGRSRRYWLA